jgi:hypothetical protein
MNGIPPTATSNDTSVFVQIDEEDIMPSSEIPLAIGKLSPGSRA